MKRSDINEELRLFAALSESSTLLTSFFFYFHLLWAETLSLLQPRMIQANMGVFLKSLLNTAVKETQLGKNFTSLGHSLMSNASPVRQNVISPEVMLQWKTPMGSLVKLQQSLVGKHC